MKAKVFFRPALLAMGLFIFQNGQAQVSTPFNNPSLPGSDYVGWDNTTTVPLQIRHDGIYPIEFHTSGSFRAQINPKMTYSLLNGFTNIPADGFTLITPDNGFLSQVKGPFSRLHLAEGGTTGNGEELGFRPWMKNGISYTGNTDQSYIGQKYRGEGGTGETDMVIQWSDNPGNWKGDRMRFLFTSSYTSTATTGMNSREGLEGMRLYPDERDFINVGIGDFFAGGDDPTERLDVRTGRVRIRQLPTDPEANTLDQYMVVDNTGVVKWRHLPPSTTTNCYWNSSGTNLLTAYQPVGSNGTCPDRSWKIGIGMNPPQYKLDIRHSQLDGPALGGLRMELRTNGAGWTNGMYSYVIPDPGSGSELKYANAVWGRVDNAGKAQPGPPDDELSRGIYGSSSTSQNLYLKASQGVAGAASATSGHVTFLYGGTFMGLNNGADVAQAYGVNAEAKNGAVNYGVRAMASGGLINYGVFGSATVDTNSWAGYFQGKVRATNYMMAAQYYTYSDASIKTGVGSLQDVDVLAKLEALVPRRYQYSPAARQRFGLPAGEQFGFVAQEVEATLPELVVASIMPAELDSTGEEVYPEMDIKAVNYQGLIPLLVAGFQAQQQQIAALQVQLAQCCAANPGMAPGGNGELKAAPATGEVKEQHLLIIPNPVSDLTKLEYYVPRAGKVSLSISTSDGKPMGTLREEEAEPGAYTYQWNTGKLAAGTYFCTYLLDGAVVVQRAVKVK
ncbi:MAG: tail fiber domain-containing protein [Flavobacteriales bacterium]|nr:tail fiber domain-containing protein [Flavobacteriales bacterium]